MDYDRWKTTAPERRIPRGIEDLLGETVVVEDRQGTIVNWESWEDEDETGRYGGYDLEVEFSDGESPHTDWISEADAVEQLKC